MSGKTAHSWGGGTRGQGVWLEGRYLVVGEGVTGEGGAGGGCRAQLFVFCPNRAGDSAQSLW